MAFSVGDTVGDYQIIEILGAGGMGTVYKVRHLISDRLEAMKLVLPELTENPDLMERFMREIKVQARLAHPNIASLHNAFRVGNQLLMVMEFVEGQTLRALLMRGRMEPQAAVGIILQVLDALQYAHAQGVVHRDIKPANVMINRLGVVKLMDFGIARSALEDNPLTQTGAAVGSIYYMSPEQVQGQPVDARADLYSVGILLYEMSTGVKPITGEGTYSVMNGHLHTIPRAPSRVNPGVSEPLSLAILRAIEKNKTDRFQTAAEFASCLMAVRSRTAAVVSAQPREFELQATELATPPIRFVGGTPAAVVTPTPPSNSSAGGTASSGAMTTGQIGSRFDQEGLERVTRELAKFIGPMAKVLVKREAKKAQTWRQLYDALAEEVPAGAERKQFLLKRP